ncbi:unnamed protein product [Penicillium glandicola]
MTHTDSSSALQMPEVKFGNIPYTNKVIIYVVQATATSYINYMKVLMMAAELNMDYEIAVVGSTKEPWYQPVHPERYVPAICDYDAVQKQVFYVFESTSCLQYLANEYDTEGLWKGRTPGERASVLSWTAYQTAGLGATSKYWLYFHKLHSEKLPKTIEKLYANCLKQYEIIEARLSQEGQQYIALCDRPSVADLAYYPFLMPYMFDFMGVSIDQYPEIKGWAQRMSERPAITRVLEFAPTIGNQLL